MVPTDIGKILSDFLTAHFDHVMDYGWTARIEDRLDQIAEGKMNKVEMLKSFYAPFHDEVAKSDDIDRSEVVGQRELGKDPATGKPIYARMTRYGAVLQVGEGGKDVEEKPRFIPLPEGKSIDTVTIEDAQAQLLLP
ncbi:hypothetical protein FACS189431_8140 [Alphaproteobacteria bacterium]|nr:hypothetical protein FACS189431_8140 [Alphaproteobacteria bacterium]